MTEHDDPSYYEIALTNRQVLVAFVILLVCMLAAFFAGLWAGRGGIPISSPDPAEVLAEQPPPPTDDGLEEFTFFSEPEEEAEEPADLDELASQPNSDTTLVEDLGGKLPPPAEPKPRIVPEDPPEQANPAIPRTTARKPPPPPATGELIVQVFSSADQKQARKVLKQMLDSGYSAFMSPVEVGELTMYRVRLGPFAERAKAEETAGSVRRRFQLETWITEN